MAKRNGSGIDIDTMLADIYRQIDSLQKDAADLERIKARFETSSHSNTVNRKNNNNGFEIDIEGLTLVEAAKEVLAHVNKPMTTHEIAEALQYLEFDTESGNFASVVSTTLNRNKGEKEGIISVGRGIWSLA